MKAKFRVTPERLEALRFSLVCLQNARCRALEHKHLHKPAVDAFDKAIAHLRVVVDAAGLAAEVTA